MKPIPQPEPEYFLGNIRTIDRSRAFEHTLELCRQFKEGIFQLDQMGKRLIFVYSQEIVNELCDEKRFQKTLSRPLQHLRQLSGDGLFTAESNEPNWAIAHRILMPTFGPKAIQDMFPQMYDVADQLCSKWERLGALHVIDLVDNMTRLTLDTIALCGFNYRFNSFYREDVHPFVNAMFETLQESNYKVARLSFIDKLMFLTNRRHRENIEFMHHIADEIIIERKNSSEDREVNDLLNRMLNGRDSVTGQGLSDENIRLQMVTFLIAGHETTSGLLSFAFYELLKHPHVLKKAQQEVDKIIGTETINAKHLSQLVYLDQILKETLRLWPTAPGFAVQSNKQEILNGEYLIEPTDIIVISNAALHRDPKVWGENVEVFDPDRMSPEKFASLPKNCWKPFGNGARACIGRPFAWQEALLVMAMVLQRFDLFENDVSYKMNIKQALTIKPAGLFVKAKVRSSWKRRNPSSFVPVSTNANNVNSSKPVGTIIKDKGPLLILFGSNSGSSEFFAQKLHQQAQHKGFDATLDHLNSYAGQLPVDIPIVIITASYEGQPTDDAKRFVSWIEKITGSNALEGLCYAVFGCGHSDWVDTYQRIPTLVDNKLSEAGGNRIIKRGEGNAAQDMFSDFDMWCCQLWNKLDANAKHNEQSSLETSIIRGQRETILRFQNLQPGKILENIDMIPKAFTEEKRICRSKRHIDIQLPNGMQYQTGDYLAILPVNSMNVVNKVLRQFNLSHDDKILLRKNISSAQNAYPTDEPISAVNLFMNYFELSQPASKRQLQILLEHVKDEMERNKISEWMQSDKVPPLLDIVNDSKTCDITLGKFLDISVPMRTRQYSISSSPLWSKEKCTITVSVLNAPAKHGKGFHEGVASNFLAHCLPDMLVSVKVRPSSFKLPCNPSVPIIMIAAGTGIAPFRGFVQERACMIQNGQSAGKALLFQGCRRPDQDYLYKEEFEQWSNLGAVELRPVFSRVGTSVKYVQDRLWECREEVGQLLLQDAHIYICGEGNGMAPAVKKVLIDIYQQVSNCIREEAEKRMSSMDNRYSVDVFI